MTARAAMKKKVGRPSKLTPEIAKKITAAIRAGNYAETAAAYAGINKATFYDWLKRGARSESGPHRDFSDAVEKALAEAEARDVENITRAAASGEWTASAWRLERKFPERWGRIDRSKVELSGHVHVDDAKESLASRVARLAARTETEPDPSGSDSGGGG